MRTKLEAPVHLLPSLLPDRWPCLYLNAVSTQESIRLSAVWGSNHCYRIIRNAQIHCVGICRVLNVQTGGTYSCHYALKGQ